MIKGKNPRLSDLGEAGALESIQRFIAPSAGAIACGFGDDAAAVRIPGSDELLLLTTDMLVEGVHFLVAGADWKAIGRKAIAVNLSDIAAMGGRAAEALISIGLPPSFLKSDLTDLYRGMTHEAKRGGAMLIGGDTVRADRPTINVTMLGRYPVSRPLPLRSNCRAGQRLYVTGTLGDSSAGLALLTKRSLKRYRDEGWGRTLIRRHRLPTPRLEAGRALATAFDDLAMIDVSDGARHECALLAAASNAALWVAAATLPLSTSLRKLAAATGADPTAHALDGGEDYELIFATAAPIDEVLDALSRNGVRLRVSCIGEVRSGAAGLTVANGPESSGAEFEHFPRLNRSTA